MCFLTLHGEDILSEQLFCRYTVFYYECFRLVRFQAIIRDELKPLVPSDSLTYRCFQRIATFLAPSSGVKITGIRIKPIVVDFVPTIKTYLYFETIDSRDCSHPDQRWITFVDDFKFVSNFERCRSTLRRKIGS